MVTSDPAGPAVAGARVTLSMPGLAPGTPASSTMSDTVGSFQFTNVPAEWLMLTATAAGHVDRRTGVLMDRPSRDVSLDLISSAPPFSLEFYRQLARDAHESQFLQPTRRWTNPPNIYVQTVLADAPVALPSKIVEQLERVFRFSIEEMSGGTLAMGRFETGPAPRQQQTGWVIVTIHQEIGAGINGRATVGPDGTMQLEYDPVRDETGVNNPFGCESLTMYIADHEIVHTMGYYHTDDRLRDFHSGQGCPGAGRPLRVRHHAKVMYSRPPGNRDPDSDPFGYSLARRTNDAGPTLSCSVLR